MDGDTSLYAADPAILVHALVIAHHVIGDLSGLTPESATCVMTSVASQSLLDAKAMGVKPSIEFLVPRLTAALRAESKQDPGAN